MREMIPSFGTTLTDKPERRGGVARGDGSHVGPAGPAEGARLASAAPFRRGTPARPPAEPPLLSLYPAEARSLEGVGPAGAGLYSCPLSFDDLGVVTGPGQAVCDR